MIPAYEKILRKLIYSNIEWDFEEGKKEISFALAFGKDCIKALFPKSANMDEVTDYFMAQVIRIQNDNDQAVREFGDQITE